MTALTVASEDCQTTPVLPCRGAQDEGSLAMQFVSEIRPAPRTSRALDAYFRRLPQEEEAAALTSGSGWFTPKLGALLSWTTLKYSVALTADVWAVFLRGTTITDATTSILREIAQNSPHGEVLAVRLGHLIDAAREEATHDLEVAEPSVLSLRDFAGFLKSEKRLAKPSLTLTFDGHLRAEWRKDGNHRVAAEFMGDGTAKLVIFAPRCHDGQVVRFLKQATVRSVVEVVEPYDVPFLAKTT